MSEVTIVNHPLVQHKLTIMRNKDTGSGRFRTLLSEISQFLCYEATRDWVTYEEEVETPLGVTAKFPKIDSKKIAFISILRAGNGMLDGMLKALPSAHAGHIGLYREPKTLSAIEYYFKLPENMSEKHAIVVDPMLATGHTSVAAVARIKDCKPKSLIFICLVASPEAVKYFQEHHPDVRLYIASIDESLNEHQYILPGLGDAGDRMFGTI